MNIGKIVKNIGETLLVIWAVLPIIVILILCACYSTQIWKFLFSLHEDAKVFFFLIFFSVYIYGFHMFNIKYLIPKKEIKYDKNYKIYIVLFDIIAGILFFSFFVVWML